MAGCSGLDFIDELLDDLALEQKQEEERIARGEDGLQRFAIEDFSSDDDDDETGEFKAQDVDPVRVSQLHFVNLMEVVMDGMMMKSSGKKKFKRWDERYFKLTRESMSYYASRDALVPKGTIFLSDLEEVRRSTTPHGKKHTLDGAFDIVCGERVYTLFAPYVDESLAWMRCIEDVKQGILDRRVVESEDEPSGIRVPVAELGEKFTVFVIEVCIGDRSFFTKWRFSDLLATHEKMAQRFPNLPPFPPKKALKNKKRDFIEQRRRALQEYFKLGSTEVMEAWQFVFARANVSHGELTPQLAP